MFWYVVLAILILAEEGQKINPSVTIFAPNS